jgi:hypothetical protein
VRVRVKHLNPSDWTFVYPGNARFAGSSSVKRTTAAAKVLDYTYVGPAGSSSWSIERVFRLSAGHVYQFVSNLPAMYFIGSVPNYERRNQLQKETSGHTRVFTMKAPYNCEYWAEWNWGAWNETDVNRNRIQIW